MKMGLLQYVFLAPVMYVSLWTGQAWAQAPIQLEAFPPTSYAPQSRVEVTTVRNYYGKCGSSVIQVLGVKDEAGDHFTVDPSSELGSAVVVLGGATKLVLKDAISDYNGVACVTKGTQKFVLIWHQCAGSACGDDYYFTVVDALSARRLTGKDSDCDSRCATQLTGSNIPAKLNTQ